MRKLIFLIVLILVQFAPILAQQNAYFGFRGEVSAVQPRTSLATDVKTGIGYGGGLAFHFPFSDNWDMTVDALFSVFNLQGNTYQFDETTANYASVGVRATQFKSFDFAYTVLRSFGDDQIFKAGLGVWYGIILKNTPMIQSDYWGNSSDLTKDYALNSLFGSNGNYGLAAEGIYNVNDALQFSLRYKLGLANLYNGNDTWYQSKLCVGAIYYFGAEQRGKNKSKRGSTQKSKYKW